jgi:enoyl-[acyl-carrier protein] reductase III
LIDLAGKVALVTGSSRGIGRASALKLAQAGADIVLNYSVSRTEALNAAEEIRAFGRKVAVVKADVIEVEDLETLFDFVDGEFGRLDILVSNVAVGAFRPLMETTPQQFLSATEYNALPLLNLVRLGRTLLTRSQSRAKVVALSSHGSDRALENYGAIGASKAALESLIRHLSLELGSEMNFNVVLAGLVATRATQQVPREMFEKVRKDSLVGERELLSEDVADAVLFLSSPLSDMIQGHTLVVDGGHGIRG